jgi:hypothetical protein
LADDSDDQLEQVNIRNNLLWAYISDLTKAFIVINHDLLHTKLELYGLRGKIHACMSSYLTDRTQFVEIQHVD